MRCCNRSSSRSRPRSSAQTAPIFASITSPASSVRRFRYWRPAARRPRRSRSAQQLSTWLREPDVYGGGRRRRRSHRRRPPAAWHQLRLTQQVIDGWRYFGYVPPEGMTDADMARRHAEVFLEVLVGNVFAKPNPSPMFPNPPGLLRLEPHSEGLRERIWWGAGTNATAQWAAKFGMNLQSSTLKIDESGKPFHVQQAEQIRALSRGLEGGGAHAHATGFSVAQHLRAGRRPRPHVLRARR